MVYLVFLRLIEVIPPFTPWNRVKGIGVEDSDSETPLLAHIDQRFCPTNGLKNTKN